MNISKIYSLFANNELINYSNKEIEIIARIKFLRITKNIIFVLLNDGTTLKNLQAVIKVKNFNNVDDLKLFAIIKIIGTIKLTLSKKEQPFEIQVSNFKIIENVSEDYPLQNKVQSNEFLRTISHLRARTSKYFAIFKIRNYLHYKLHQFFYQKNFLNMNGPILTTNDAEGAGEVFTINDPNYSFFKKKVNLTVSSQLTIEAFAQIYQKIYSFAPTFRAEHSNTKRHCAEFWMLEVEITNCDLNKIILFTIKLIKELFKGVLQNCDLELSLLSKSNNQDLKAKLNKIITSDFNIISYSKAIEIINAQKEFEPIKWGEDLELIHEKFLTDQYFKNVVVIHSYPKKIKSFYMKQNSNSPQKETVGGFDMLLNEVGEVVGGSERENNYSKIIQNCIDKKIDTKYLKWYLDLRKYAYLPSAGFGLGFDRLLMFITGITNIKDVIFFPRYFNNIFY